MDSDNSNEQNSTPKLSYLSPTNKILEPLEMLSPPRKPLASVPFQWEEAPGKPRPIFAINNLQDMAEKCLELPPRLLNEAILSNMSSPTTVLDGPYASSRSGFLTQSFRKIGSSFRSPEIRENVVFGSSRWDASVGETKVKMTACGKRRVFFNSSNTKSRQFLASIYEGFKQIVPSKRRQEKWRRMSS